MNDKVIKCTKQKTRTGLEFIEESLAHEFVTAFLKDDVEINLEEPEMKLEVKH